MPPAAILGIGIGAQAIGGMLAQSAANKGPRALFPGLQSEALSLLGGKKGLGAASIGGLQSMITNPGALPDVSAAVDPAFNALVAANKQFTQQGLANLKEQFGSQGLGASSPFAIGASNYITQSNADFMNILAQYTLQAQEQAANRQLAAETTGAQMFLGPAFTDVGPKGSVLGAGLGAAGGGLQTIAMLQALGGFGRGPGQGPGSYA